jgi:hypothetical protein
MSRLFLLAALLASAAPAATMPDFVPKPSEVYEGYVALEMPRTDVPVGALWVQDYGPSGEGAAADNLVTERSLSQVTINSELHLGLTAGILNLFGLDPSYRNKLSARFGDLSIVRVKDMSKLSGPSSEPRIYEAVRAGTVTITTDNDIGLDLDTRVAGKNLPIVGRSDNGRRRSFSIDGKDMFIAFRVASQEEVKSSVEGVKLRRSEDGWQAVLHGHEFVLQTAQACGSSLAGPRSEQPSPSLLRAQPGTDSPNSPPAIGGAVAPDTPQSVPAGSTREKPFVLPLRVPVADGKGGLFERANVEIAPKLATDNKGQATLCSASEPSLRANVQLLGRRLQPFRSPRAPRW